SIRVSTAAAAVAAVAAAAAASRTAKTSRALAGATARKPAATAKAECARISVEESHGCLILRSAQNEPPSLSGRLTARCACGARVLRTYARGLRASSSDPELSSGDGFLVG